MEQKPIYIFDLDGTLADTSHRVHHIAKAPKNWDAFYAACVDDPPLSATVRTSAALYLGGAEIQVWTGRSDAVRSETLKWLSRHVPWLAKGAQNEPQLRMREHGDHQTDVALKLSWLKSLSSDERSRIVAVFEDRASVVQMWRRQGITCYQVDKGDF